VEFLLEEGFMSLLSWIIVLFSAAIITAVVGFGGVAVSAAAIAQAIFFSFLALFMTLLVLVLFSKERRATR
jgi:uncharacterized membrane protein YtjA (UPF0391 family)